MLAKKAHVVPASLSDLLAHLWLTYWMFSLLAMPALSANPSYRHQPIASTKKTETESCRLISTGPGVDLKEENPGLHRLLDDFLKNFKGEEFSKIHTFFHSRAKVKKSIGDKIQAILAHRYSKPWEFSIFRVWELRHPDKSKSIYQCPQADNSQIISRYGYANQYMVWIQILGQNELGRLLISIAPDTKQELVIVGFHIQQWTQSGKDWEYWTRQGNERLQEKQPLHAYFAYDVARKLLEGGDFVAYEFKKEITATQETIFSQAELVRKLQALVPIQSIAYVASALNRDGVGLFVRLRVPSDKSTADLQKECKALGSALIKASWLNPDYSGLRCNFLLPTEVAERDGRLGGFYFTRAELLQASKISSNAASSKKDP